MSSHRASHLLHLTLFIANPSALSHDISRPLKSFLTVSVQFFSCLPVLFLPSGTQCNIWFALLSLFLRNTWPSHHQSFLPDDVLHILLSLTLPYTFGCDFVAP